MLFSTIPFCHLFLLKENCSLVRFKTSGNALQFTAESVDIVHFVRPGSVVATMLSVHAGASFSVLSGNFDIVPKFLRELVSPSSRYSRCANSLWAALNRQNCWRELHS
jgi:hypothetical protein